MALEVWLTTCAKQVLEVLGGLNAHQGTPGHLRSDNGPEFVAVAVQEWLARCHVATP